MTPTTRKTTPTPPHPTTHWARHLTTTAFVLALILVAARAMMLEYLREPFPVLPDTAPQPQAIAPTPVTPTPIDPAPDPPRAPGPATTLTLNLLAWIPAILILLRATLDRAFLIRWRYSHLPLAALAIWIAASVLWTTGDRFASIIAASTIVSALLLLWAMSHLCADPARLRIVAGIAFGLLLVYIAQGAIYRYVEWPEILETWNQQREQLLAQRGWAEDSFAAQQFEQRVLAGDLAPFAASANTYAAMLVLLAVIAAGAAIQRIALRDEPLWPILILASLPFAAWAIVHTRSRTALITPILAAIILLLIRFLRPHLARRPRLFFSLALLLIALAAAAVIAHGLHYNHLIHDTLTFRWHYWTASFHLFTDHWLTGVGWNNFAHHYLAYRLPIAPEEVQDPHNLFVRFATETGIIGLTLLLTWLLILWHELTTPHSSFVIRHSSFPALPPPSPISDLRSPSLSTLTLIAALAIALNILAALDLTQPLIEISIDLLKRALFFCLLLAGLAIVCMKSTTEQSTDTRPAPWLLYAILTALALFLLHNQIDFAFFENGPLFTFAALTGAALALRSQPPSPHLQSPISDLPSPPSPASSFVIRISSFTLITLLCLTAALALLLPTALAESHAHTADQHIRNNRLIDAAQALDRAHNALPYNADYPYRAAHALAAANAPPHQIHQRLAAAIAANPRAIPYYLDRARYNLTRPTPNPDPIIADYTTALALNPNDISIHIEFARTLESLNHPQQALHHYQQALHYNNQLPPHEPKRLSLQQEQRIQHRIEELQ